MLVKGKVAERGPRGDTLTARNKYIFKGGKKRSFQSGVQEPQMWKKKEKDRELCRAWGGRKEGATEGTTT